MTHPEVPEEIRGTYAGARPPGDHRPPHDARRHRDRADAGAPVRADTTLHGPGPVATTGATTPSASSPRTTTTPPPASAASRCRSSRRWSRRCTRPASRSSSTSSTTTPPRATTSGPTLCFRGIDNAAYYRLVDDDQAHYYDNTGTGNSLLMRHPHVLQLIMDSLRYWVTEMHVDGFRFDLAATLAREFHEVDRLSAFFDLVQQDPVVSPGQADRRAVGRRRRRLPGRQLPAAVDRVERQVPRHRPRLLARRARARWASSPPGSPARSDLYEHDAAAARSRRINFVTAHDGFTLRDLVSYNEKHNEANGEDNRDGESHNRSWNCGVEGPTDDPEINALRAAPAAQLPRHAAAQPGRADDRPRRRDRPHPARQQQRLLPGQRAVLGRLGPRRRRRRDLLDFTAAVVRAAPRAPGLPPAPVLRRQRRPRRRVRARRHRLVHARRRAR